MRRLVAAGALIGLIAGALPAAAKEPPLYQRPDPAPDPAAQLDEMVGLFDEVCVRAFPDDAAVARAMDARGAARLNAAEVRMYLHDDPGVGWRLAGRTARFAVTVEGRPFHACGVRTVTASGFADLAPYRALLDRYENGAAWDRIPPQTMNAGDIESTGGGEGRNLPNGGSETFLLFSSTPVESARADAGDGIEIRFVHQIVDQTN